MAPVRIAVSTPVRVSATTPYTAHNMPVSVLVVGRGQLGQRGDHAGCLRGSGQQNPAVVHGHRLVRAVGE